MTELNSGAMVECEGREGIWAVTGHDKGWFRIERGDEVHKARLKQLTLVDVADDEEEEEEESVAKRMAKTLNAYKPNYADCTAYSGAKSLNNGDRIAKVLEGASPEVVAAIADKVMGESDGYHLARYSHLNPGQVRMNSGNRIRAAVVKREEVPMEDFLAAAKATGISVD